MEAEEFFAYALKNYIIYLQVKAAVLDPGNEFNVERTLTKEDVKKLIQVMLSLLTEGMLKNK